MESVVRATQHEATNALVHLYRGELGRMTAYRTRLDTTTNWAVGATAAITTFVLSDPHLPHFTFLLGLFLNSIFLWMEARRFRGYELIRHRVRLLEEGFYVELLRGEARENWQRALIESLRRPSQQVSYLQAFSVRLRRNYIWLMGTLYLGWLVKLELEGELPEAAGFGTVSGTVVLTVTVFLFVPLFALASVHRPPEQG
jgi:uncharacterized membrane protein